jgi:hypothetical protein
MEIGFAKQTEAMEKQAHFNARVETAMNEDKKYKESLDKHVGSIDTTLRELPNTIVISSAQVCVCTRIPLASEAVWPDVLLCLLVKVVVDTQPTDDEGTRDVTLKDWHQDVKGNLETHDADIATLKREMRRHEEEISLRARIDYELKVDQMGQVVRDIKAKLDAQDLIDLNVSAITQGHTSAKAMVVTRAPVLLACTHRISAGTSPRALVSPGSCG